MGSGKSSVGRALATAMGRPHCDSDVDLQATTGQTAREVAAADGIAALHALESAHLLDALGRGEPSVISAAASVVDDPVARMALTDPGIEVIWLRATRVTLAHRAATGDHRPDPAAVSDQARLRDRHFASVADRIVDVDDRSVEQIVASLLD